MNEISIVLKREGAPGFYAAYYKERRLCHSTRPFIDAARALSHFAVKDPDVMLHAYHEGAAEWCLRGKIAAVAWTTISDRRMRTIKAEKRREPA